MAADKGKADGTGVPGRGGAQLGEWAKLCFFTRTVSAGTIPCDTDHALLRGIGLPRHHSAVYAGVV